MIIFSPNKHFELNTLKEGSDGYKELSTNHVHSKYTGKCASIYVTLHFVILCSSWYNDSKDGDPKCINGVGSFP